MFCKNCGSEIQQEWSVCPKCGTSLGEIDNVEEKDTSNPDKKISGQMTRDELKEELVNSAFSEKGGVVLAYGARAISKDLVRILNPDEEIVCFYHADRSSLLGFLKPARMFREYLVCTNQRMVYIENGTKIFSLLPFLKTEISFPYKDIGDVTVGKRIGIFSGKVTVESNKRNMAFAVTNIKSAEEIKELLLKNRM